MSLENFFGLDDSDSAGSAEASEAFKEQMRKNAAALQAIATHQAAQKTKEDRLAKFLVKFLQTQSDNDLVFLVIKLLQENIPGAFILACLSIIDKEILTELVKEAPEELASLKIAAVEELPQEIREDLNTWGEAILLAGLMLPGKTLSTVLTSENKLKSIVLDLLVYVLETYFENRGLEYSEEQIRQFALLSIQSVLIKLRDRAQEKTDAEIIESTE